MAVKIIQVASRPPVRSSSELKLRNELFYASFTRKHNPTYGARLILGDKLHPLYHRSMSRFLALPRDMLWIHITVNPLPFDAVRRNACRRRIAAVLAEAFRNANFDLNAMLWAGKRAEMMKRHNQCPRVKSQGSLTGTLHITAREELLYAKRGLIKKHIDVLVVKLKGLGQEN